MSRMEETTMSRPAHRYVLLTAAKNEEAYIGTAIGSVLRQTVPPVAWLVMDDGSTDRTAAIVADHAARHGFIRLRSNRSGGARSFGAQYRAINAAYAQVRDEDFDFVCVQDADIAPANADYFERLLQAFDADPRLGIAGGYIHERSAGEWRCRRSNAPHSVAGGVQMFRRRCFEQIGGYTPLAFGGEDWLAQIEAQALGWRVRALTELAVHHHRPTSTADGRLRGLFRMGMRDASFGSHPLFELMKCARRITERPALLSALVRYAGFVWYLQTVRRPSLSSEQVKRLRDEQMLRVREWLPRWSIPRQDPR